MINMNSNELNESIDLKMKDIHRIAEETINDCKRTRKYLKNISIAIIIGLGIIIISSLIIAISFPIIISLLK
jgi:CHASE3 domain sensor protein